jgi:dihydrofolate synthase/folylpolyglutamate synthase
VGNPHAGLRFVHVAGTNGKGSVAMDLLTILARAGYRVGLYTSPHLSSVRERFRINDEFIAKTEFAEHASRIHASLAGQQITYFEFTTALALLWFVERQVDLAILEVGMGGRLDATNVVRPLVSVITNVSMDHEAYLGNTLELVALEKSGIIKPGVPVVSGVANDASRTVVERTCRLRGAPLFLLGRDFNCTPATETAWNYQPLRRSGQVLADLRCGLAGAHQRDNGAVALATLELLGRQGLEVPETVIRQGLAAVRWPARLEYICLDAGDNVVGAQGFGRPVACPTGTGPMSPGLRRFLIDGAHNPAGVESLARVLEKEHPGAGIILVWGSMEDKDAASGLARLAPLCQEVILTRVAGERAAEPAALLAVMSLAVQSRSRCLPVVAEALRRAIDLAGAHGLVCIAGSLYLAGAVRQLLVGGVVEDE